MEAEQIQAFTRRLSQCNKGEMIVIIYDIYFEYAKDAKKALASDNFDDYKKAIHHAQATISELIHALDFSYEISKNLYDLYIFCRNQLSRALYEYRLDGILEAEKVLKRLYASFLVVAKEDTSEPLMSNAQQVYAGMTYGKSDLNETYANLDYDRGFFV